VPARPDNAAVSSDPRRLREVLDAAGYAEPTVLAALGLPRLPDARGMERRMLLHRTRGGSPLETLVRLLLLGEPVDEPAFLSAWRRRRSPTGRAPAWSRRTVTSSVRCCGCDRTAGCFSPTTPLAARASRYSAARQPSLAEGWSLERLTPPSRLFGANGLRTGPDGRVYIAQVTGSQISALDPATGRTAQYTAASKARMPNARMLDNGSDNALIDDFLDPAFGCTPFEAPDLANHGAMTTSQALDELLVNLLLDEQAAAGRAALAAVEVDGVEGAGHGQVEVGVGEDDVGALAAQLQRHALHALGGGAHDDLAHLG